VRSGDSLWTISQKFPGVSVQNIKDWNGISGTKLKPGMKLKISKS
jgi:membrane-bound lytic murein transglycosylase D